MIVGFGRSLPDGYLPVFAVADEKEAQDLITLSCPTNMHRQHYSPELAEEQTLENLDRFSERLIRAHNLMKTKGQCRCHLTTEPVLKKKKTSTRK